MTQIANLNANVMQTMRNLDACINSLERYVNDHWTAITLDDPGEKAIADNLKSFIKRLEDLSKGFVTQL